MNNNIEKTCECNHSIIAKMFEEDVNNPLGEKWKYNLQKKSNPLGNAIVNFFATKKSFRRIICNRNFLLKIWPC